MMQALKIKLIVSFGPQRVHGTILLFVFFVIVLDVYCIIL